MEIESSLFAYNSEFKGIMLIKSVSMRVYFILIVLYRGDKIERVRESKIVRVIVGATRSIFYHLGLHQEIWRLRPKE